MAELRFTDCTLTTGDNAVWGGRLTGPMALRLARRLGRAGLAAIEVLDPETIAACIRRGENPWRRAEDIAAACPGTPLRARMSPLIAHGAGGHDVLDAQDLAEWVQRLAGAGVGEILCDDPLDDPDRMAAMLASVRAAGARPLAVLAFDPDADDAAHAARAAELLRAGVEDVQLRDEAGTLTTDRLPGLLAALNGALGGALSLHPGCASGLGPQVAFAALAAGVERLDVALPSLANGPSLPSVLNLLRGAPAAGVEATGPDMAALQAAEDWLAEAAAREGWQPSSPWNFDLAPWIHRLPGAALAPLQELHEPGSLLHAFAHEAARVAQEAGALPPRPPFAAAIARQALWHVTGRGAVAERWSRIHPVLARAIRGAYGTLPAAPALAARLGRIGPDTVPRTPLTGGLEHRIGGAVTGAIPPDGYRETSPAEALALGLLAHMGAGGFAHVTVTGPDLSISMSSGGQDA